MIKSTIYLREYFYTTLCGLDIEYRSLSYYELENIQTKYTNKRNQSTTITVKTSLLNKEDFNMLTQKDLELLYNLILDSSIVSNKDIESIKTSVAIIMADNFKEDTFKDCKLCKERGLDKQRNCPLLDTKTHDKGVFYLVDGKKLTECPMDEVSNSLVSDALRCYSMHEGGFLPKEGGVYDQPMFFIEAAQVVKSVIDKAQTKALEKTK